VQTFGRLAWRRPLTDAEITRVTATGVKAAQAYNSFDAGLGTTISALLQSPYFLYIIEVGVPDKLDPKVRRLTGLELATRMSFFLLSSTPDAKLLDDVDKGALDDEAGIRAVATAMLQRAEAKTTLAAFYSEVYHLRELTTAAKDPVLYPQFDAALKVSMQNETLLLINDVVWTRDADARELLSADYTFVDKDLAEPTAPPPPRAAASPGSTCPPSRSAQGSSARRASSPAARTTRRRRRRGAATSCARRSSAIRSRRPRRR
jgi:hypothetical protein